MIFDFFLTRRNPIRLNIRSNTSLQLDCTEPCVLNLVSSLASPEITFDPTVL